MRCIDCGFEMKKKIIDYNYDECGLKNVLLKNMEYHSCPNCPQEGALIPSVGELHNLIATTVASQPSRLIPEEIRLLRTHLGFSGVDFARAIDVAPETVSRWETGKEKISLSLERFLRTLVLYRFGPYRNYDQELTQLGITKKSKPIRRVFIAKNHKWKEAA